MSQQDDPSPWIEVGALAQAFEPGANVLAASADLAGSNVSIQLTTGEGLHYCFIEGGRLIYKTGSGLEQEVAARITSIRRDIYLVDHLSSPASAGSVSLVLDLKRGRALVLTTQLPTQAAALRPLRERLAAGSSLTTVSADFRTGDIGGAQAGNRPPISSTDELIGTHNRYVYSENEIYDHIYLNTHCYAWHCISGAEVGLADVDRCQTFKIDEGLYLFSWQEKIIPTLGLLLIDLDQGRTDGKIIGYRDADFASVVNFPVGAKIVPMTRLNGLGAAHA